MSKHNPRFSLETEYRRTWEADSFWLSDSKDNISWKGKKNQPKPKKKGNKAA